MKKDLQLALMKQPLQDPMDENVVKKLELCVQHHKILEEI